MGSNKMFSICVQFKWGRTGTYSSDVGFEVGNCVIVAVEGGIDLGMVARSEEVESQLLDDVSTEGCVLRVAKEEEVSAWKGELVAKETTARRLANKILPENTSNVRVLNAEYRFDEKVVILLYTRSGEPKLAPSMPKLHSTFSQCEVRLNEVRPPPAPVALPTPAPAYPRHSFQQRLRALPNNTALKVQRPPTGHAHSREESMDSVFSSYVLFFFFFAFVNIIGSMKRERLFSVSSQRFSQPCCVSHGDDHRWPKLLET